MSVSLSVYQELLPYSGTDISKSIICQSDSCLCQYCYIEDPILLEWDAVSVDKQILPCQGSVGCHITLPCHVGIQILMDRASSPRKAETSTTQIVKVLQQHFFNSKADTLELAIDLGDTLKDASKSVCEQEH